MWYEYWDAVLDIWLDMAPWLLLGMLIAFLCSYFLTEKRMHRHLGGQGWCPIVKASFFGLPLPLCSCGVLPVALALRHSGARKSAVCAFMASTPQSGSDALPLTWSMLGPVMMLLRLVGAVISGLVCGALVRWYGVAVPPLHETENLEPDCAGLCGCHHHDSEHPHLEGEAHHHEFASRSERVRDAARYAFIHLPGELSILLAIGVLIAAALTVCIPENLFQGVALPVAYLLAMLIGIPTYACSVAIVPVAAGLIANGLTPGTAFIFLVCAPTTHVGALLVLGRNLGWRTVVCFVVGVVSVAVLMALLIDFPLASWVTLPSQALLSHEHSHRLGFYFLVPVVALLLYGTYAETFRHSCRNKGAR